MDPKNIYRDLKIHQPCINGTVHIVASASTRGQSYRRLRHKRFQNFSLVKDARVKTCIFSPDGCGLVMVLQVVKIGSRKNSYPRLRLRWFCGYYLSHRFSYRFLLGMSEVCRRYQQDLNCNCLFHSRDNGFSPEIVNSF